MRWSYWLLSMRLERREGRLFFRFLTDKCGYIRWKTPAREAAHVPAQGFSIHYLTFFDRLFFDLPRIVMPSSISFPPTLIGEEPFFLARIYLRISQHIMHYT